MQTRTFFATDALRAVIAGAEVRVYTAGTLTPVATYNAAGALVAQPLIADAVGRVDIRIANATVDIVFTSAALATTLSGQVFYSPAADVARPPVPQDFGAAWNNITDDTDALNAFSRFLATSRKAGILPPDFVLAERTLYWGDAKITGQGGPSNAASPSSKSVIRSNAPIGVSMAPAENIPATYFGTEWSSFTVLGNAAGSAPNELWDRAVYPYQIGLWLGRNHNFMQTVAGGELPTMGGSGGLTMRNISVSDFSGWGAVGNKLWGQSVGDTIFFRRCGGRAAFELGDDRLGGAMYFSGVSVDFKFTNVHSYVNNNADPNFDRRGTGLRIGARRTDTDALGRLWEAGGNQKFDGVFFERHAYPFVIESTKSAMIDQASVSGEECFFGYGPNPGGDCKVVFGAWRDFQIEKIHIHQSDEIDLGSFLVQSAAPGGLEILYSSGFRWQRPGGDDTGGFYHKPVRLVPIADAKGETGLRGLTGFRPHAATNIDPTEMGRNLLPAFSAAGQSFAPWTANAQGGGGAGSPWRAQLYEGRAITSPNIAAPNDELMTLAAWCSISANVNGSDILAAVLDETGAVIIERAFGTGSILGATAPERRLMMLNFRMPASGLCKVRLSKNALNSVYFEHPVLVPGALGSPGKRRLGLWPTPAGMISCI